MNVDILKTNISLNRMYLSTYNILYAKDKYEKGDDEKKGDIIKKIYGERSSEGIKMIGGDYETMGNIFDDSGLSTPKTPKKAPQSLTLPILSANSNDEQIKNAIRQIVEQSFDYAEMIFNTSKSAVNQTTLEQTGSSQHDVMYMNPLFMAYDRAFAWPDGTHDQAERGKAGKLFTEFFKNKYTTDTAWYELTSGIIGTAVRPTRYYCNDNITASMINVCGSGSKKCWGRMNDHDAHHFIEPVSSQKRVICNVTTPILENNTYNELIDGTVTNAYNMTLINDINVPFSNRKVRTQALKGKVKNTPDYITLKNEVDKRNGMINTYLGAIPSQLSITRNLGVFDCPGPKPTDLESILGDDGTLRRAKTSALLSNNWDAAASKKESIQSVLGETLRYVNEGSTSFVIPWCRWIYEPGESKLRLSPRSEFRSYKQPARDPATQSIDPNSKLIEIMWRVFIPPENESFNLNGTTIQPKSNERLFVFRYEMWIADTVYGKSEPSNPEIVSDWATISEDEKEAPGVVATEAFILRAVGGKISLTEKIITSLFSSSLGWKTKKKDPVYRWYNRLRIMFDQIWDRGMNKLLGTPNINSPTIGATPKDSLSPNLKYASTSDNEMYRLFLSGFLFRAKTMGDNLRLVDPAYINSRYMILPRLPNGTLSSQTLGTALLGTCDGASGPKAAASKNVPCILAPRSMWDRFYMYSPYGLSEEQLQAIKSQQVIQKRKKEFIKHVYMHIVDVIQTIAPDMKKAPTLLKIFNNSKKKALTDFLKPVSSLGEYENRLKSDKFKEVMQKLQKFLRSSNSNYAKVLFQVYYMGEDLKKLKDQVHQEIICDFFMTSGSESQIKKQEYNNNLVDSRSVNRKTQRVTNYPVDVIYNHWEDKDELEDAVIEELRILENISYKTKLIFEVIIGLSLLRQICVKINKIHSNNGVINNINNAINLINQLEKDEIDIDNAHEELTKLNDEMTLDIGLFDYGLMKKLLGDKFKKPPTNGESVFRKMFDNNGINYNLTSTLFAFTNKVSKDDDGDFGIKIIPNTFETKDFIKTVTLLNGLVRSINCKKSSCTEWNGIASTHIDIERMLFILKRITHNDNIYPTLQEFSEEKESLLDSLFISENYNIDAAKALCKKYFGYINFTCAKIVNMVGGVNPQEQMEMRRSQYKTGVTPIPVKERVSKTLTKQKQRRQLAMAKKRSIPQQLINNIYKNIDSKLKLLFKTIFTESPNMPQINLITERVSTNINSKIKNILDLISNTPVSQFIYLKQSFNLSNLNEADGIYKEIKSDCMNILQLSLNSNKTKMLLDEFSDLDDLMVDMYKTAIKIVVSQKMPTLNVDPFYKSYLSGEISSLEVNEDALILSILKHKINMLLKNRSVTPSIIYTKGSKNVLSAKEMEKYIPEDSVFGSILSKINADNLTGEFPTDFYNYLLENKDLYKNILSEFISDIEIDPSRKLMLFTGAPPSENAADNFYNIIISILLQNFKSNNILPDIQEYANWSDRQNLSISQVQSLDITQFLYYYLMQNIQLCPTAGLSRTMAASMKCNGVTIKDYNQLNDIIVAFFKYISNYIRDVNSLLSDIVMATNLNKANKTDFGVIGSIVFQTTGFYEDDETIEMSGGSTKHTRKRYNKKISLKNKSLKRR